MILYGSQYWGGLFNWIQDTMLSMENISDSPEEITNIVREAYYASSIFEKENPHREKSIR